MNQASNNPAVHLEEAPLLAGEPELVQPDVVVLELGDVDHRDVRDSADVVAVRPVVAVPDVPVRHRLQARPVQLLDVVDLAYLDLSGCHGTCSLQCNETTWPVLVCLISSCPASSIESLCEVAICIAGSQDFS
jgi:hypothetical protein